MCILIKLSSKAAAIVILCWMHWLLFIVMNFVTITVNLVFHVYVFFFCKCLIEEMNNCFHDNIHIKPRLLYPKCTYMTPDIRVCVANNILRLIFTWLLSSWARVGIPSSSRMIWLGNTWVGIWLPLRSITNPDPPMTVGNVSRSGYPYDTHL